MTKTPPLVSLLIIRLTFLNLIFERAKIQRKEGPLKNCIWLTLELGEPENYYVITINMSQL